MMIFASRWSPLVQFSSVAVESRGREGDCTTKIPLCRILAGARRGLDITPIHLCLRRNSGPLIVNRSLVGAPSTGPTVTVVDWILRLYDSGRRLTHRGRTCRNSLSSDSPSPSPTRRTWSSRNAWCSERTPENTLSDTTDVISVQHLR